MPYKKILCLVYLLMLGFGSQTYAADEGRIVRGAKLYDSWFKVIEADKPDTTHPAWPASNTKKKGDVTWRCKSCHGWDYKGKDGAYSSGPYQTGIKGIQVFVGADLEKIIAILKNDTHQLSDKLATQDFNDLSLFVSAGQVDMSAYIDSSGKQIQAGDAGKGKNYFDTICAQCHGVNGDMPKDMEKTLGAQLGNRWEVMHKILNGQPGEHMPALRALDRQIVLDIMAHLDTLPKTK